MSESDQIIFDKITEMECPSCHSEIDVSALDAFSTAACPNCGEALTIPARLGNYRLLSSLGSGGMGRVYRAYDETLARIVAIKVMQRKLGDQPEYLESFRREAQAAAKLNHPNIAQIYSFGQENGQPYIVMELVPGKHLDKMIEEPEQLSQPMIMKIGMDIADGLQLAAVSNLIHGDIKPENILLDDREVAKLVDFGIASSPDADTTEIWGTPYYISPEKIKREKVDFRSDMYCLGGTLYHAITKHPPFDGADPMEVVKARLEAAPRSLREFRPDVDPEVEEIILRMLQLDPSKRYPTYGSLMSDIRRYLARVEPQQAVPSSGGGSKKIIIKGRNAAKRAQGQTAEFASENLEIETETDVAMTTGTHKGIRISKTNKIMTTSLSRMTGGIEPVSPPEEDLEQERKRKAKVIRNVCILIGIGVVALVIAVIGFFSWVKSGQEKKLQAQRNAMASQVQTMGSLYSLCLDTFKIREMKVESSLARANLIVSNMLSAVEAELGTEFTAHITAEEAIEIPAFDDTFDEGADAEEEEFEEEDTDSEEEVADEEEEEVTTSKKKRSKKSVAKKTSRKKSSVKSSKKSKKAKVVEEETEEEETNEEEVFEEEESEAETVEEETQEGEAEAEGMEETVEGVVEEETIPELEGIPAKAREIYVMLQPVRKAKVFADRTCDSVNGLYALAMTSTNVMVQVALENDEKLHAQVQSNLDRLQVIKGKIEQRKQGLEAEVDGLESILKDADSKYKELLDETNKLKIEREAEAARAKEQEEVRIEREKKEAAAAALRAAEEVELSKVRGVILVNMEKIRAQKFDSVLKELDEMDGKLKYKQSNRALKAEKRRVQGLIDIKAFMIKQLMSENKFTHRQNRWTVTEVDDRRIEVLPAKKGAQPVRQRWTELDPIKHIVPILRFYLDDEEKLKDIGLNERSEAYFNAAIYFVLFAGDNEQAKMLAKQYAEKSFEKKPSKKKEVLETLYEIDFSNEDDVGFGE